MRASRTRVTSHALKKTLSKFLQESTKRSPEASSHDSEDSGETLPPKDGAMVIGYSRIPFRERFRYAAKKERLTSPSRTSRPSSPSTSSQHLCDRMTGNPGVANVCLPSSSSLLQPTYFNCWIQTVAPMNKIMLHILEMWPVCLLVLQCHRHGIS